MAKDIATKASKFRDIDSIMRNPQDRATLTNLIDEAVKCKGAIATQQANIKVLRDEAVEGLSLSPKLFNAYVAASFNNDYSVRKEGLDQQLSLLEHIMGLTNVTYQKGEEDEGDE